MRVYLQYARFQIKSWLLFRSKSRTHRGGLQALMHEIGLGYGLMNPYYCHISTHKFVWGAIFRWSYFNLIPAIHLTATDQHRSTNPSIPCEAAGHIFRPLPSTSIWNIIGLSVKASLTSINEISSLDLPDHGPYKEELNIIGISIFSLTAWRSI